MKTIITLDFGSITLDAELFDSAIAENLTKLLPCSIQLQKWGEELFGSVGVDLGAENPVPTIPPGGIAYTNSGNYLCIFFGQTPAWPVEYIGQINENKWEILLKDPVLSSVTISIKD